MSFHPAQIRRIAEAIAKEIASPASLAAAGHGAQASSSPVPPAPVVSDRGVGVFETVDQCVAAASRAFAELVCS